MNFIIQKLKNKHIFLKKLSNWAKLNSLILREREETITKYFAPKTSDITLKRKQFCTPREGNPGNVLLTSRNRLKYFYQCSLQMQPEHFNRSTEFKKKYFWQWSQYSWKLEWKYFWTLLAGVLSKKVKTTQIKMINHFYCLIFRLHSLSQKSISL